MSEERFDWDRAEAELSAREGPGVLVDSADAQRQPGRVTIAGLKAAQRRPLLPAWAKSRAELREIGRWSAGHAAHAVAYHVLRSPKYAGRLLVRSPRGATRVLGGLSRWVSDAESVPLRQACARTNDPETYLKLTRQRDRRVRWRGGCAVALVLTGLLLLAVMSAAAGPVQFVLFLTLVTVLGVIGRRPDQATFDTAVLVPKVARLTSDVVVRALSVLGIGQITQALSRDPKAIGFVSPITRDGPGWRADINLPPGVTAGEVMEHRDKLASGLARPLGCVWPKAQHEVSPSRLVLWVGDQDMATAKQPVWPLSKAGTVDLFKAFPFGTDPRGRAVWLELVATNLLIGSIPGVGKTFALRLPLLAAALCPRAELWVYELKGTGDLQPLEKCSARYASGAEDEHVLAALQGLRDLRRECARRAKVIKGLPKSVCPENKVTPELASRPGPGLHELVVAIDECQELFSHSEYGKEAGGLAEQVVKLGRALGVILLLATQRPDAKSLPTGVSANVGTRFCLRVMGQMENDMILGTSSYKNGLRATMFTRRDKGVGYLVGAADDAQIVKTYYIDGPTAEKITVRARAAREAAGTITGHAAGHETVLERDTLLDDLLTVMPATEAKAWNETLTARLAELAPGKYRGWNTERLTVALKPYGVSTGQVWGTDPTTGAGANRRGITRIHVVHAHTQHTREHDRPPPGG
jgi:S-DNA-T family DNA segregation ATPase FtsK/SpoIIIE